MFTISSSYIGWTGILRTMKNDVLDFLLFDLEHGHFGMETTENMIRTCNMLNLPAIVRVADTEYHLISKVLDFGADGILIPRVETVEQAKKAINSIRFPPIGKKGCGGSHGNGCCWWLLVAVMAVFVGVMTVAVMVMVVIVPPLTAAVAEATDEDGGSRNSAEKRRK